MRHKCVVRDEPAIHLDQALETYDGALLLVTHDRRMLQNVRLDCAKRVDDDRVAEL